jgi:hypothetical protein
MTALTVARRAPIVVGAAAAALLCLHPVSRASIFGEENITLAAILTQATKSYHELRTITDTVADSVEVATELVDAYERVNAGIDELRSYSVDAFLRDFKGDVYALYPGLERIEHGSARLKDWDRTRTDSPFTAYEAISALAGDLTQPLRDDVEAGRRSIDRELILQREAAGGFALADVSESSTRAYDREIQRLRDRYQRSASPGTASMIAAHTNLIVAEQNSHIIRLLARTVRLDGVNKALSAAERIGALRDSYRRGEATQALVVDALRPPPMMRFQAMEW